MWLTRKVEHGGRLIGERFRLVSDFRRRSGRRRTACPRKFFAARCSFSRSLTIMSIPDPAFTPALSSTFSSPNPQLFTPPPSHTSLQQVPDVFVIPPEEEHDENPPFCYFDAATESKTDLSTTPDIDALDVALGFYQQTEGNPAPMFHRLLASQSQETIVMPRRSGSISQDLPRPAVPLARGNSRRDIDEDVVEVVKVRKTEGVSNTPTESRTYTLKKSKTFRARATQALRSIKNVGKSNRRVGIPETWSTASGRENMTDNPSEEGVLARPPPHSLVRRKSIQLSQIFTTSRGRTTAPDVPMSPTSPTSSEWAAISRPSLSIEDCMNAPYSSSTSRSIDAPSLSKGRSFVRRISVLDLHKLFGPSTPTSPKPPPLPSVSKENITSAPLSPSNIDAVTLPSAVSNSFGGTDDVFSAVSADSHSRLFHAGGTQYSLPPTTAFDEMDEAADTSLELHLDSLHFDSLHFDPDEFSMMT